MVAMSVYQLYANAASETSLDYLKLINLQVEVSICDGDLPKCCCQHIWNGHTDRVDGQESVLYISWSH